MVVIILEFLGILFVLFEMVIAALGIFNVIQFTLDLVFSAKIYKLLNNENNRRMLESVIFEKDKKSKSKGDNKNDKGN